MTDEIEPTPNPADNIQLTTDIVASFVNNNTISVEELPGLIQSVYSTMADLSNAQSKPVNQKPAVSVARSIKDDYIVCLEDGAKLKMLKRYIRTRFNLTPDEYRQKWKLPSDYPMVAPAYARRRSDLAREIGLGKGRRKAKAKK